MTTLEEVEAELAAAGDKLVIFDFTATWYVERVDGWVDGLYTGPT